MGWNVGRLSVGTRVGPYEIVQFHHAGGMGEVYRARDSKLQRDVAIKILPGAIVAEAGALARFRREAQLLASLNHPNIATVHGLEDEGDVRALVMEFVEGRMLKDVIADGLSLGDATALARQIARALEAAHEHGIIHRDLKPANIIVRDDGTVKVLDFGLAKALEPPGARLADSADAELATLTSPARLGGDEPGTQAGVILGTAAYMSPEQARGRPVDKRADIWAFGVVLYEMVTGRRLFSGEHVTDVIAAVVKDTPDLGAAPTSLRRLLEKCLEKDPRKRLRDISSVELLLDAAADTSRMATATGRRWPMNMAGAVSLAAVAAIAALAVLAFARMPVEPEAPPVEFVLEAPPGTTFMNLVSGSAASPDGQYIVLSAAEAGKPVALWLRRLAETDARLLPGTEGGTAPVWSPDSRSIAFMAQKTLKRIDLGGGAPVTLAEVPNADADQPGAWSPDGLILFGCPCGLDSVAATGGQPTMLRRVDRDAKEVRYGSPQFLPDGTSFIYFVESSDPKVQGVYASTLADPAERTLILNTSAKAVYVAPRGAHPGYLLWLEGQTLQARPFDAATLEWQGEPVSLAENVATTGTAAQRAGFWTSNTGLLVVAHGGAVPTIQPLVWMDRSGQSLGEARPAADFGAVAISPDDRFAAFAVAGPGQTTAGRPGMFDDVWILDIARQTTTRLTFGKGYFNHNPVWSPDGRQMAFSSNRDGYYQLFRKDVSGAGEEERLASFPKHMDPLDWSPDGRYLLYREQNLGTGWDLFLLPIEGDRTPIPLVVTPTADSGAKFSPDGKWVAFHSRVNADTPDLFLQAFSGDGTIGLTGPRIQISTGGGGAPVWRQDGKELYYHRQDGRILAVTLSYAPRLQVGVPQLLFTVPLAATQNQPKDALGDGSRFLLVLSPTDKPTPARMTVITNWQARQAN